MGIRVLLVDAQALVLDELKRVLQVERDLEVVGVAAGGDDAVEQAAVLRPDLVLIDVELPDGNGIAAVQRIKARCPDTSVLVLTGSASRDLFRQAAAVGAVGYLLKDVTPASLVHAIRAVHSGSTILSPAIARQVVERHDAASDARGIGRRRHDVVRRSGASQRNARRLTAARDKAGSPGGERGVDRPVWIRGDRLRDARASVGLRLADVAGDAMSVQALSRLETSGTKALPFSVVVGLVRNAGILLPGTVTPRTWTHDVLDHALLWLQRGRFDRVLHTLRVRDLLGPVDRRTEIAALVLEEWARWHCGGEWRPGRMRLLRADAREAGAVRPWLWAGVFESAMHDRNGTPEQATDVVVSALPVAEREGEPLDVLCVRAAAGRLFARQELPAPGLEIVNAVEGVWDRGTPFGQARLLYSRGVLYGVAGELGRAKDALWHSSEIAMEIPNPMLAAQAERALMEIHEAQGECDAADAAATRAAMWFMEAGMKQEAREVLKQALRGRVYVPLSAIEALSGAAICVERGGYRVRV